MTLKGENLRLYSGGRCVAAALSATIHASVKTDDATSKDSPSGWDEIEVTGKSLDISADALFKVDDIMNFTLLCTSTFTKSGSTYSTDNILRHVKEGDIITITCEEEIGICIFDKYKYDIIVNTSEGELEWEAEEDMDVYLCCYGQQQHPCSVQWQSNAMTAEDFIEFLKSQETIPFEICTSDGYHNREDDDEIISGNAYVTDISINSSNRQKVTYTVSLNATGEVSLPENVTGNSSLDTGDDDGGQNIGNDPGLYDGDLSDDDDPSRTQHD